MFGLIDLSAVQLQYESQSPKPKRSMCLRFDLTAAKLRGGLQAGDDEQTSSKQKNRTEQKNTEKQHRRADGLGTDHWLTNCRELGKSV